MAKYIYDLPDWPRFRWNREELGNSLAMLRHQQGKFIGHMEALEFALREEAVLNTLTEDVVKTSEIEGEILNPIMCAPQSRAASAWISARSSRQTEGSKASSK